MNPTQTRGFAEAAPVFDREATAPPGQLREVQASVAKAHFSQLLDDVERGATIVILRHGRPVARIAPDPEARKSKIAEAFENIAKIAKERRERFGPMSLDEILSLRHEGHKY